MKTAEKEEEEKKITHKNERVLTKYDELRDVYVFRKWALKWQK